MQQRSYYLNLNQQIVISNLILIILIIINMYVLSLVPLQKKKYEILNIYFISHFISADPFIEQGFEAAPEETQLVIVEVGDRPL